MTANKSSYIDTDVVLRIGGYREEKLLSKILLSFGYTLYIHEYLVKEELISGGIAKEQLEEMITRKEVKIIRESDLSEVELFEYHSTLSLLAEEMGVDLQKKRDHNGGEVRSMAMAFTKDAEYFISDDGDARVAAKKHLQKLDGTYLETIKMKDIITHIKNNSERMGISRKTAKKLYLNGTSPKLALNLSEKTLLERINGRLKIEFDSFLWPVNE